MADSFASTLTRLAGAAGTAGQAALMAQAKAEEESAKTSSSKVRLGKDGKPKPVKNVTFKPEQDLVSIKWIEAREETEVRPVARSRFEPPLMRCSACRAITTYRSAHWTATRVWP